MGQREFGEKCGVSKTSQFNYEANDRHPDTVYLQAAHTLGVDVGYIITGERAYGPDAPFVVIPCHSVRASAGDGAINEDELQVNGLSFNRQWLQAKGLQEDSLRVISVVGDSMANRLAEGDRVLVDLSQTLPRSGFAYVLRTGEELLVKYCQLIGNGVLRVSSENPSFPPYDIDLSRAPDVAILGRVVASMQEW